MWTTEILAAAIGTAVIFSWICFLCRGIDCCGGRIVNRSRNQTIRTDSNNSTREGEI